MATIIKKTKKVKTLYINIFSKHMKPTANGDKYYIKMV